MKKSKSIFRKIFIPVLCLLLLEIFVFVSIIYFGGVIDNLHYYAANTLSERVAMRASEISSQFSMQWGKLDSGADELNDILTDMNISARRLLTTDDAQREYLLSSVDILVRTLRQNHVNGAFVILNDGVTANGTDNEKYGLCIRDYDQASAYFDTEDLLVDRAPASIITQLGVPLDSWWEPYYTFKAGEDNNYFYAPLNAAFASPDAAASDLAYLCAPHRMSETDAEMLTYSMPLIDEHGTPYGVFGIELRTEYLVSLLPSAELDGANHGTYILAENDVGSDEFTIYAQDGAFAQRCFLTSTVIEKEGEEDGGVYRFKAAEHATAQPCGAVSYITVYNNNTPFENEQLALIGIISEQSLSSIGSRVMQMLAIAAVLSIVIGFFSIMIACRFLSQPISELSSKVAKGAGGDSLPHIGITEIDRLTDSIKDLNARERESYAKSEFFARMSHDMRTPMNAIIGFSGKELVSEATEAQKTEYLSKIHESAEYLLGLINEVLDMSKVEKDRIQLNPEPVRMADIWGAAIPLIKEIAEQKNVNFTYKTKGDSLTVMADRQRVQQILVNLLSNAVKFTPEGGTVTFEAVCEERDASTAVTKFTVKDTGAGMSSDFLQKLYTPFERENHSAEGTGLGLSICKRLVDLMHGDIKCQSEVGRGTTFTVTLKNPITSVMPKDEQPQISSGDSLENLNGARILLCEDHPLNTQIAVKLLEREGCKVDCAENGKQGVDKFDASPADYYSAVLMDIRMPVMTGLEAARAIRQLSRPDAKTVPIIAMTANAFDEDVRRSRDSGMNAHLSKPINPDVLYQTLNALIKPAAEKADEGDETV